MKGKEGDRMKVIFLDIDGVLYPCRKRISPYTTFRFDREQLVKHYQCAAIRDLSDYDLACAQNGVAHSAIQLLKTLIQKSNAVIVISSSWKFSHTLPQLKALFAFYALQDAIVDSTSNDYGFLKTPAIRAYLKDHPNITQYIVVDDLNMENEFHEHAITCPDLFDEACYQKALNVLSH